MSLIGGLIGHERRLMVQEGDVLLNLEFAMGRALAGHESPLVSFTFVNNQGKSVDILLKIALRSVRDVDKKV